MEGNHRPLNNLFFIENISDDSYINAISYYWSVTVSKLYTFGRVSSDLFINHVWPYVLESFQPNICETERTLLYDNIQYIIYTSELLVGDHKLHCQGNLTFGSSIPIPSPPSFSSKKLWYMFTYQSFLHAGYCLGFYCLISLLCNLLCFYPLKMAFYCYMIFSTVMFFCHFWVYHTRIDGLNSIYRLTHALQSFEDVANRVYTQICELGHPDGPERSSDIVGQHNRVFQVSRNQELMSRQVSDLFAKVLPSYQELLSRVYPFTAPFYLRDLLLLYKLPNCFTSTSTPFSLKQNLNRNLQRNSLYCLRKEANEYNSHSNESLLYLVKSYSDLTVVLKQILCCILSYSVQTFPQECTSWSTLCHNIDSFVATLCEFTEQLSSFPPFMPESGVLTPENEHFNYSTRNRIVDVDDLKKKLQKLHFAMLETHENISLHLQENPDVHSQEGALKEYDHFGFQLKGLISEWEFYRDMLNPMNSSPRKKD